MRHLMRTCGWCVALVAMGLAACGDEGGTGPGACDCTIPGICETSEGATCDDAGVCTYPAAADGDACDDGDACNGHETCDAAAGCVAGEALVCGDGEPCNGTEICDADAGCVTGTPPSCDDGDVCNGTETCEAGMGCVAGEALVCDDGDICNGVETCDGEAGCAAGMALACDDGLACNGVETCDGTAGCVLGEQAEGCCAEDSECEDGNPCNGVGFCSLSTWTCMMNPPAVCDDQNPCNGLESCEPDKGCVAGEAPTCDDQNTCNGLESCDPASGCVGGTPPVCDDQNACNGLEMCQSAVGCVVGTPPICDDGDACNGLESCDASAGCTAGAPPDCDDGLPCNGAETCVATVGCMAGEPVAACCAGDADCDNLDACDGQETCESATSTCLQAAPVQCDDGDACTVDACDAATGACSNEPVTCDDGNACTEEACVTSTGACAYQITNCDDASVCTLDTCDAATGCVHDPITCDDGSLCNGVETCDAADGCQAGVAVTCDDDDVCNGLESCDPATGDCVAGVALVCTDGNPCNGSEYCLPGQGCIAGMAMNCDDGIPCTLDSCDTEMWVCVNHDVCAEAMTDGMMVYTTPADDGNTFACNTCHALDEPAEDGIRRSGHRLGDATRRPSYKNGLLTDMLDAANSCRTGWMNASAWDEADPSWLALYTWLDDQAPDGDAPALEFEIVQPPDPPTGGDAEAGQGLFNMACVMCHGVDAVGTLRGPPLAGTGLPPSYITLRVRTSGATDSPVYDELTGGIMPFWSASRLTDDEVRNLAAFVSTSTAPEPEPPDDPIEPIDPGEECDATHARVGWTTTLSTKFHGVQGVATMVDDCTIVVEDFHFDGNGIDVQVYAGDDGDYNAGFSVSDQLYNFPTGYDGDTLILKLPADKTLDDVDGISVWCVTVGVSFGDGLFAPPPEPETGCSSDHARVGWTTTLSTKFHGVEGVATMVDDCTIVVEDFAFDGNGIDVQVYAGKSGNYNAGFSVSDQLYNYPIGYQGATLTLTVPEGKTLDDVDGISVWCVTVGVSFGDGLFAPP